MQTPDPMPISNAEIDALFSAMDDLVLIRDRSGRCLKILTPRSPLLYRPYPELLGKSLHESFPPSVADVLLNGIQTVLSTRSSLQREYSLPVDGHLVWFDARLSPIGADTVLFVIRDVSDRKRLELALQRKNAILKLQVGEQTQNFHISQASLRLREQELTTLLAHLPDAIARFNTNLQCVYINPVVLTITGFTAQQIIGKYLLDIAFPQSLLDFWHVKLQETLLSGIESSIYFQASTRHGVRYFETKLVPELGDHKNIETILTISRDITALKEAEIALRQGEERFRKLFENAPVAIGVARLTDGYFVQVNPAYSTILGYTEAELLATSFRDISYPDDIAEDLAQIRQLQQGTLSNYQMEKRFLRKDGSIIWTKLTVTLLRNFEEGVDYSMGMIEDITDRKNAENALRQSEERFRHMFDNAPMPMGLADIKTHRILRVNAAYQRWLGYSYDELYRMSYLELTHPEDVESEIRLAAEMQTGHLAEFQLQKRFLHKSGASIWAQISTSTIRDQNDQPIYSLCLAQDITQAMQLKVARNQAEAALRRQSQRDRLLRIITQHIHQSLNLDEILAIAVIEVRHTLNADRVLIFQVQPDGSGVVVQESVASNYTATKNNNVNNTPLSPACYRLYQQGVPRIVMNIAEDECNFRPTHYLQAVSTKTKMVAPILQIDAHGNTLWGLITVHSCATYREWQTDEAELLQQIANQLAIAIQQATLYQQVQTDLVKQQEAEASLRSLLQEKEVLLKEVHHRVKNNLQVISSLLRMQSRQVDEPTGQLFREAQNRVQSIAIIHEHLYQSNDLSYINFADYVQILVNHLSRSYGVSSQHVKIKLNIQPVNLSFNTMIPCGLIINELVSNSLKYAFINQQAGEIRIELTATPETICEEEPSPKQWVQLIVQDDGIGLPPDLNWQTSRSLGLRIVRTLVAQLKGHITQETNNGSIFRMTFYTTPSDATLSE